MNLENRILELKKLTVKKDLRFSEAVDYFMDHFSENTEVFQESKPYKNNQEFYQALFEPVLQHQGNNVKIISLFLVSMEQYHFIHGTAQFSNGKMAMLYYFEDIQMGLTAVSQLGQANVNYYRLSCLKTTKDLDKLITPTFVNKIEH